MNLKRPIKFLLAAAVTLLAACAALTPSTVTVTVTEARIMEVLARQFPMKLRVLEFFELTIDSPQLRLMPAENRLATRFDFSVGMPALGKQFKGMTGVSYGLRYEHSDDTIRLADVHLDSFNVPGMPTLYEPQLRQLISARVGELFNDYPIHKVPENNRLAMQRAGLRPDHPQVTPAGLEVKLRKK